MASRHSVDLHLNSRRASEELPWQYLGSSQATPSDYNQKGFADWHSVNSSEKGSSRRRSFHGSELKRETRKTSAPVSIVGLGCWAPSQSTKSVKQASHHASQEPLVPLAGGHDSSSEKRGSMQGKTELHFPCSTESAIQTSENSPMAYDCPLPDPFVLDKTHTDGFWKSTAHHKGTQRSTTDKSRRRQQQDVKELQVAILRLSSKLKRMDLDEVLLPATSQDLAAEKRGHDEVSVVKQERLQEISPLNMDEGYMVQEEDINHGRDFGQSKTGRVHSRHRAPRRRKDYCPSNHPQSQLSCHLEETDGHDGIVQDADSLFQIHAAEDDIQASENVKAEAVDVEFLEKENPENVGVIELEILPSPRKGICVIDPLAVGQVLKGDDAMLALKLTAEADVAEISSTDHGDEIPDSNATSLCFQDIPELEQVLNKEQDAAQASHSTSHLDAAKSPASDSTSNDIDCNLAKSPCFSELLLSSSDVTSPSSEDSSQLSEALQNLSGGQGHKVAKTEESLTTCSHSPHAKQSTEQSFQTFDRKERVCCKKHPLLTSLSRVNRSGSFSSGDRERALLWIHEQDKASQSSAVDIDLTLILKRFGNFLLSSIPCEGMHMVALEPLFHETITIAKSFLREFSSLLLELSQDFFTNEYFEEQRDRKVSLVRVAPLPNALFVHQHHIKFGVQALVNKPIFVGFDKPLYCGYSLNADCWVLLVEFQRFCMLSPTDAINPLSDSHNRYFHNLCCKKLQLLKNKCPWMIEWPDYLLEVFLRAMKYVWQAYLIARASVGTISLLQFEEWSPYDSSVMEVVDYDHDAAAFISRVQFFLSPGFKLQGSVVKSEVYLVPKT